MKIYTDMRLRSREQPTAGMVQLNNHLLRYSLVSKLTPLRSLNHIRPVHSVRHLYTSTFPLLLCRPPCLVHEPSSDSTPLMDGLYRVLRIGQSFEQLGLCI